MKFVHDDRDFAQLQPADPPVEHPEHRQGLHDKTDDRTDGHAAFAEPPE